MPRALEVLDRIARSEDAVFAIDAHDLIILWNRGCERLTGRPPHRVLGRRCYDILCGRDVYGNVYCYDNCPIAHSARNRPEKQIQQMELDVLCKPMDETRRFQVATFVVPAVQASLATIVHVMREPGGAVSSLEHELEEAIGYPPTPRWQPRTLDGDRVALTKREQEILRRMATGLRTSAIASELFISKVTVRNHISNILQKLDVHTKLAAVAFAYRNGLISVDESDPTVSSGLAS